MRKFRKSKAIKVISLFVAINFLTQIFYPTVALALTAGPNSPEFSSFTPVTTTDMVDLTSGDFNYNLPVIEIPGGEGGGYALSLSYNSGASSEAEASWVGFGWNLNPGAINRSVNGLPDDYNGEEILSYNKTKPNWSVSKSSRIGIEFFSANFSDLANAVKIGGLSVSNTVRYNSYNGFMASSGIGLNAFGLSAGMNIDPNGVTFSGSINPVALLSTISDLKKDPSPTSSDADAQTDQDKTEVDLKKSLFKSLNSAKGTALGAMASQPFGLLGRSLRVRTMSTSLTKYYGYGINSSMSGQLNASIPVGPEIGFSFGYNLMVNQYKTSNASYGYLYSSSTSNTHDQRMDYYVEKPGTAFNNRDYFIGIPFNNNDYFHVTGEGLTGSFKAAHKKMGHYIPTFPNPDGKNMSIFNSGFEFMFGHNFGLGGDVGRGWKDTDIDMADNIIYGFTASDDIQFRFKNDKGGELKYSSDLDDSGTKNISAIPLPILFSAGFIEENEANSVRQDDGNTSSFIEFNTKEKIDDGSEQFNKDLSIGDFNKDRIIEYGIYNDNGYHYVYGQPVFIKNKTDLFVDVDPVIQADNIKDNYLAYRELLLFNNDGNYTVDETRLSVNEEGGHSQVVGEIQNSEYANNYLLTAITGPNFIDVNNDGPDSEDFGTWTKFNYKKVHEDYRFRNPYNGLFYQKNSLSDDEDDIGSISTGEKEVYYLESIETNTHIAYFVTNTFEEDMDANGYATGDGSLDVRFDGLDAKALGTDKSLPDPASEKDAYGENRLQRLEKIVLFSKERKDTPIKTVHLDYDYSLVKNTPNSFDPLTNTKKGKLTLKKLWFTYNGTSPAKISPYEFSYEYKKTDGVSNSLESYFIEYDKFDYTLEENPDYSPQLLDKWGNKMQYAEERHEHLIPWNYQGHDLSYAANLQNSWRKNISSGDNDPGAWHLKQIQLPTGGEIIVQYEEDSYKTVQDKPVMAMASLVNYHNRDLDNKPIQTPYYDINLDDLGFEFKDENGDPFDEQTVSEKLEVYLLQLNKYFGLDGSAQTEGYVAKNKIYFKYLFDLTGIAPHVNSKSSEYITGYATVDNIEIIADDPIINDITGHNSTLRFTLGEEGTFLSRPALTPEVAAYEFYVNTKQGKLNETKFRNMFFGESLEKAERFAEEEGEDMNSLNSDEPPVPKGSPILKPKIKMVTDITPLWLGFTYFVKFNTQHKDDICLNLSPALSYLKIPMYGEKKGGGSRVKRLMIYDNGSGAGEEMIFGSEYHYVLNDGRTTSGVATNEPVREENPFVNYMFRGDQSNFDRLTSGEDKKQTEGPLGETLLPGASVVYSRVVVNNIHSNMENYGQTGTGFTVSEYYTSKDYPFDGSYKIIDDNTVDEKYDLVEGREGVKISELKKDEEIMYQPMGLINIDDAQLKMAQGFRFIRNNMNGQLKSITSYGGEYTPHPTEKDTENGYIVAYQKNTYFEPGEKVKVLSWNDVSKTITSVYKLPGKEIELAYEKKRFKDLTFNFSVEFDISFTVAPPIFFTLIPTIDIANNYISMHATSKIIDYPVILKSVENYKDGIISKTENLAFSNLNGTPIYTKTYDSYHGLEFPGIGEHEGGIYSLSIPAAWMYTEMGQKTVLATNMNSLNAITAQLTAYGYDNDDELIENFKPGDASVQLDRITSLSVQTYDNLWYNDLGDKEKGIYSFPGGNGIDEFNALYYPSVSYAYNAKENSTYNSDAKTWNSGWFTVAEMFDWEDLPMEDDENWVAATTVTKYSPNGSPLEEKNALGIPSAVMYGADYGSHLPVILSQNADYNSIFFESFENIENNIEMSHSGYYSKFIDGQTTITGENSIYSTNKLKDKGALIKFWSTEENADNIDVDFNGTLFSPEKIARTGEWTLYSIQIPEGDIPAVTNEPIPIRINPKTGSFYMDDFRFQPYESSSTCYVYDMYTFKLLTQFDDQHFGLFYKYNAEGQLVRKMIETERGMKTIQENQYHTVQK